ncbi:DNA polymerase I [Ligilactobacillus agilis]|nr:DNA polymerase I [Ligilactobacillus agilis]
MAEKKLLLIDGNSVAFRAFYALYNSVDRFTNHDGLHTNALYGFNTMLDKLLKTEEPSNILVAFDAGKKTFRTEKFAAYKGNRNKTPKELTEQLPYFPDLLAGYGIKSYQLVNFEADDIIGTMAKAAENQGYQVTIVTGDRDLTQLTTDKVTVAVTKKGVSEVEYYTPEYIAEKFAGLNPRQIIDMKALVGDSSDNYPGVTKVGEKTAIKLLTQYDSVEGIYQNIEQMKQSKLKENLLNDREVAFLCKDLAEIRQDAPVEISLADTKWAGVDDEKLRAFYQEMDFKSFLSKMQVSEEKTAAPLEYTVLTAANLDLISERQPKEVAFYLEMDSPNYHKAELTGFSLKLDDSYFVSRNCQLLKQPALKELLAKQAVDVFDGKRTYVGLKRLGLELARVDFDLLLVSYLLDNSENSNDLGILAQAHGYQEIASDEVVYGKGAKFKLPSDDDVYFEHLVHKVKAIAALKADLYQQLKANQQEQLYFEMERPLSLVLAEMELAGIKVDIDCLESMQSKFKERLAEIEQVIYQEAGKEFNINSPKQLGTVLFEDLGLPYAKKTKTGYSTAAPILEKLQGQAPIVDNILQYRQLAKLQSTYVEGLLKVADETDHKVHTRYTQTLTATGRLSSVDPNLQNIPVRLEEGRKIRQAFVPSKPGWEIFSSDYSQIELRVLAHISGDENMQAAFKSGLDIHANTAMNIFNLDSPDEVTPNLRRQAKAVNFGIVYGISDFGLARNIGITNKEAKTFIDNYFAAFPGVHQYMQKSVALAKKQGYVETLFKRRRYLPDIHAKNFNLRSFAERTAMNTPIQGSAADIIKVAMIRMNEMLAKENLTAKMLLQVHDELIFEAPKEEIPILERLVPEVMDSAVKLTVPLKVESKHGRSWFDAK